MKALAVRMCLGATLFTIGCLTTSVGAGDAPIQRVNDEKLTSVVQLAEFGDPQMQFELGVAYALGLRLPQNLTTAKQWLEKSAEQGYKPARDVLLILGASGSLSQGKNQKDQRSPEELYELGVKYMKGLGVKEDPAAAAALFREAAARGHKRSKNMLDYLTK